ncbi:iron complex transport system substrate-binding protein [Paenibacillus algorifonticola]|uniref:Iron complex transport system substrate-binding protein n=1 Tax=Paenibacillus algorifonticola TaxID=684063 RepID=A0A1I2IC32_9BACL|nr:AraC family transcriptional regulator [Paenibacillus algorifonticola]SFF39794.1 iron complex transport system substrate-binding protein [Paenibacillus algorifonticola]
MNHQSLIQHWVHSSFHIFDIRHFVLLSGEAMPPYPLPANAFLLLCRGQGTAMFNDRTFTLSRSCLLHADKGLHLQIHSVEQLEFYLILYKSELTSSRHSIHATESEADNSMTAPLGFVPEFPVLLHQHAREMYDAWLNGGDLSRFKTKTIFYLFMHEVLRQLDNPSFLADKPDIVDQAIRYIEEHMLEAVTLDSIARELNYNIQYLSKKFKAKTGRSPIDYLIYVRMEKAARLLLETDETIQHIAQSVGYSDLFYFIKRFKKHTGLVPGQFRKQAAHSCLPDVPSKRLKSSIWSHPSLLYTKSRTVSNEFRVKKGDSYVSKEFKTPLAAAMLLCMMIMISACGVETPSSPSTQRVQYEHAMGVTEVTGIPDKIAAADYRILDTLYALGIKPYATTTYGGSTELPYLEKDVQSETILALGDKINLEAAVETEPDLIIARHIEPEVYEQLSKVAPVLVFRGDGDWREEMREIGSAVGKEAEAAAWLEQYDQKAAEIKEKIAEHVGPDETFLFVRLQKDVQAASPNVHLAATLSKDLGLTYVAQLANQEESYSALSLEALPELNPDHIFMTVGKSTVSHDDDAEKLLADMKESAVWSSLKAVQSDNVHIMPQWVFGDYPNIKSKSLELVEAALVKR